MKIQLPKRSILILTSACVGLSLFMSAAQAQRASVTYTIIGPQTRSNIIDHRGVSRSNSSVQTDLSKVPPLPLLKREMPTGYRSLAAAASKNLPANISPTFTSGWLPGTGPQPDPSEVHTLSKDQAAKLNMGGSDFKVYGSAPTNPLNGPYAPFQRWTWYQNYTRQATATIGKLFIDRDGDGIYDGSCTATVIGQRTIATAAHCMDSGGFTGFAYDSWLFCPSWYESSLGVGSSHPSRGCWEGSVGRVSQSWVDTPNGNTDRDFGCIITDPTGDVHNDKVGNITGWVGYTTNWFSYEVPTMEFGYPGESPFRSYHIIVSSSPEWYFVDMTPSDAVYGTSPIEHWSKYIGSDQTGGSSGGPWWMNVRHKLSTAEVPDTDGPSFPTDPYPSTTGGLPDGPFLNGVVSHSRCVNGCFEPPTTTAGTFWQEHGSPDFISWPGDNDDVDDIFGWCLANE